MTERSKRARLRRFLHKNKLLFVRVGARADEDEVIQTCMVRNGATVEHPEYTRLINEIVKLFRDSS